MVADGVEHVPGGHQQVGPGLADASEDDTEPSLPEQHAEMDVGDLDDPDRRGPRRKPRGRDRDPTDADEGGLDRRPADDQGRCRGYPPKEARAAERGDERVRGNAARNRRSEIPEIRREVEHEQIERDPHPDKREQFRGVEESRPVAKQPAEKRGDDHQGEGQAQHERCRTAQAQLPAGLPPEIGVDAAVDGRGDEKEDGELGAWGTHDLYYTTNGEKGT
jgi:hypothetical protein